MEIINPFELADPAVAPIEVFSYADPLLKGRIFSIRLQALDVPMALKAYEVRQGLIRTYITGDPDTKIPARPFLVRMELSELLCRLASELWVMQMPPEDGPSPNAWTIENAEKRLTPEMLLAYSKKLPDTWNRLIAFRRDLNQRFDEDLGKASEDAGADTSGPSSGTAAGTLPSSSGDLTSSGASTTDSPAAPA